MTGTGGEAAPAAYDNGGALPAGLAVVTNRTGKTEQVVVVWPEKGVRR